MESEYTSSHDFSHLSSTGDGWGEIDHRSSLKFYNNGILILESFMPHKEGSSSYTRDTDTLYCILLFFFSLLSSSGRIPMVKHVVLHWWCSSGPGVDKTTEYIMEPRLLWDHWEADLSHSILCCSKHNSYYRRKHLKLDGSLLYFLWICDLLQQSWNNETSFAFVYYCFDRQVSSGPISSLTPSTEPENITNYDQVYAMMTSFYTM